MLGYHIIKSKSGSEFSECTTRKRRRYTDVSLDKPEHVSRVLCKFRQSLSRLPPSLRAAQ